MTCPRRWRKSVKELSKRSSKKLHRKMKIKNSKKRLLNPLRKLPKRLRQWLSLKQLLRKRESLPRHNKRRKHSDSLLDVKLMRF